MVSVSLTALREFMLSPNPDLLKADGIVFYFDRQTGQIVASMTSRDQEAFDEDEDRYVRMPEESSDDAWQMRCDFAEFFKDDEQKQQLLHALQGKGGFRYFNDIIQQLGLEWAWDDYQADRREERALKWCRENGVDVVDDLNSGERA